jgi:hypothetical protein
MINLSDTRFDRSSSQIPTDGIARMTCDLGDRFNALALFVKYADFHTPFLI